MVLATLLLLAFPAALTAAEPEVVLCLENQREVTPATLASFQNALRDLSPELGAAITFRCDNLRPPFLLVTFRDAPRPQQPENALASMLTEGGKVLPRMEAYLTPVRRMLPSRLEVVEGRALAWVAGHELLHFLNQRMNHDHRGWFGAELNTAMLLVRPSAYRGKNHR